MNIVIISVLCIGLGLASFLVVLLFVRDRLRSTPQSPENRGLFRFNDGLIVRYVDPIEVMMVFEREKEYSPEIHAKLARNGHANSIRIQCDAIKNAFGVVDYSGPKQPGLTVSEMTRLLYAFWSYVDLQKKKYQPFVDLCGIYGCDISRIRENDYEQFVALWISRTRGSAKLGIAVRNGVYAALGPDIGVKPSKSWYYDTSDSDDLAKVSMEIDAMRRLQRKQ